MTADLELTAREAAKSLRNWRKSNTEADTRGVAHVGEGVLRCALCGTTLVVAQEDKGWYAASFSYSCADPGCGQGALPVAEVDRELEEFTRRRLKEPAVVAAWRATRLAELDEQIADARPILPWCWDQRRRRQLSRRLAPSEWLFTPYTCTSGSRHYLYFFGTELTDLIVERARTVAEPQRGRSVGELVQAEREWTYLWLDIHRLKRRQVRRMLGRRALQEIDDDWEQRQTRLWDLLKETDWQYSGPARQPLEDRAMDQEWSQSPGVMARQRRSLLAYALGDNQLVLSATVDAGSRVRVVPAVS
ncbi:hypothetical protein EDD27_6017 [Nonomuraea polychroma]|uniref:Uncharacterized protein n=1 Tax=Nonomuraea polychroma TaxID=46176 RepID=A0A438MC95_9ACTN|nr:hypothetical protein [Nonomuraea polychroma]RVX43336.1 hypothetical protein EDD27_6017 [Nonomuraea polychroma]